MKQQLRKKMIMIKKKDEEGNYLQYTLYSFLRQFGFQFIIIIQLKSFQSA